MKVSRIWPWPANFLHREAFAKARGPGFRKWPSLWTAENLSACISEIFIWLLSIPRRASKACINFLCASNRVLCSAQV